MSIVYAPELRFELACARDWAPNDDDVQCLIIVLLVAQKNGYSCHSVSTICQQAKEMVDQLKVQGLLASEITAVIKRGWQVMCASELTVSVADYQDNTSSTLLVTEGDFCWFQRAYQQEKRIVQLLLDRSTVADNQSDTVAASSVDLDQLRIGNYGLVDAQQRAALASLTSATMVVTGGPGTGKTTTLIGMLFARVWASTSQPIARAVPLLALAAPTGKAAQRMAESLHASMQLIDPTTPGYPAVAALIKSAQPQTIHKLIGVPGHLAGRTWHSYDNPLPAYGLVVVDEVSMLDLDRFEEVVAALHPTSQLVLLGDPDQLPAVEIGSVLRDLHIANTAPVPGLTCIHLTQSHRFTAGGQIGQEARRVIAGVENTATSPAGDSVPDSDDNGVDDGSYFLWSDDQNIDDALHRWGNGNPMAFAGIAEALSEGYAAAEKAASQHRILCMLRDGPQGVIAINAAIDRQFGMGREWYHGRMVMITRNAYDDDYALYNGDIGFYNQRSGLVEFARVALTPSTLPPYESCYAMTVHKSQGSEFRHIALVLPNVGPSSQLSIDQSMLYTAITRCKSTQSTPGGVTVIGPRVVYEDAIGMAADHRSGLHRILARSTKQG